MYRDTSDRLLGSTDSYKDGIEGGKKPGASAIKSKATRKLRSDLIGSTPALKAARFADLHHAKSAEVKKKEKRAKGGIISTKSWLEQAEEGETEAAKSFKERKSQSFKEKDKAGKANLNSESLKKRMGAIKHDLNSGAF